MLATASKSGFNYKDVDAESTSMKSGDTRILADGDITIEAGNSITLKVGRTFVKISDAGFSIRSQLIESAVSNPFDSAFNLSNKDGISMFGKTVGINSGYKWSIGSGLGASISGTVANVALSGRQIEMSTQGMVDQVFSDLMYGTDMAMSIAMASAALDANRHETHAENAQKWQYGLLAADNTIKAVINLALIICYKEIHVNGGVFNGDKPSLPLTRALQAVDAAQNTADANALLAAATALRPYTLLSMCFNLLMGLVNTARIITEDVVGTSSAAGRLWHGASNGAGDFIDVKGSERDTINLAFLVVENTIVESFAAAATLVSNVSLGKNPLASASVSLLQNGGINMAGDYLSTDYGKSTDAAGAAPTLVPKWAAIASYAASFMAPVTSVTNEILDTIAAAESVSSSATPPPPLGS
jgi:hypothetical protein